MPIHRVPDGELEETFKRLVRAGEKVVSVMPHRDEEFYEVRTTVEIETRA